MASPQPANQIPVRRLDSAAQGFPAALAALTAVETVRDEQLERTVAGILGDVRRRGDPAVLDYTKQFDGVAVSSASELEISRADLQAAVSGLAGAERDMLELAAARVRSFHERQLATSWRYTESDGTVLGQRITPLDRVGLYVPGGRAAYPSSVIMNAVPAKVAGVPEITMVVPTPRGERNRLVLAAAALSGVDRVLTIGGAQAIGALAYGTESIRNVDKIVGPGNAYVAAAKRQVFGQVGIDMIAGPSEILIICDGETDPDWIAMDLCSQAEHDEMAQAILLCPDADFLDKVESSLKRALERLPRREVIEGSIAKRGALIKVRDLDEACEIANDIAPEHLELSVSEPEVLLEKIRHAGAIFLGRDTSEALGDYCAGPNHVLPTSRSARFSSPLGVYPETLQHHRGIAGWREGIGPSSRRIGAGRGTRGACAFGGISDGRKVTSAGPDKIIRDEIRDVSAYHVQPAGDMVKLDAMENPYDLPEPLRRELAALVFSAPLNRYPDPRAPLLRRRLRQTMGIPDEFDILLGNGSDELIQVMVQACARPGATVLSLAPSFVMYRMYALIVGVKFHSVSLEADFSLDPEKIVAAIRESQPALIFISYPNNPTGNLFSDSVMSTILREAPGLVVVDEAYQPFAGSSYLDRLGEHPNLVVLRTLSKLGLAGIRLGYATGRPAWIREFDKVRSPYNVNVLTQLVAERVLAHYDVLEQQAAAIRADREQLSLDLARFAGFTVFPSRANFLLVRVPDATALFDELSRRKVLIKNAHGVHPVLDQCLRITVGTPAENRQLVGAIESALGMQADGTPAGVRVR